MTKTQTQQTNTNTNATTQQQTIICTDNVQQLAQRITLRAVKTVVQASADAFIIKLYNNLVADIISNNINGFSDGFDLVQTCACFLWQYNGNDLQTTLIRNKDGKKMSILRACFSILNKQIYANKKRFYTHTYIEDLQNNGKYIQVPFEWDTPTFCDYDIIIKIINKMQLSQNEKKFISYRLRGLSLQDIASKMGVSRDSCNMYRKRVQEKARKIDFAPKQK